MMRRIFLAIPVPEGLKKNLLNVRKKLPELPARWTKPENLHITLVFLGSASDRELEEVRRVVREAGKRHRPAPVSLARIRYAPDANSPRMIWAEGDASPELKLLQEDLASSLGSSQALAFTPENRPFHLHLTLARLKEWEFKRMDPEEMPHAAEEIDVEFLAGKIDIMESKLKRSGAEYALVDSVAL